VGHVGVHVREQRLPAGHADVQQAQRRYRVRRAVRARPVRPPRAGPREPVPQDAALSQSHRHLAGPVRAHSSHLCPRMLPSAKVIGTWRDQYVHTAPTCAPGCCPQPKSSVRDQCVHTAPTPRSPPTQRTVPQPAHTAVLCMCPTQRTRAIGLCAARRALWHHTALWQHTARCPFSAKGSLPALGKVAHTTRTLVT
jgi:hypothetical protein